VRLAVALARNAHRIPRQPKPHRPKPPPLERKQAATRAEAAANSSARTAANTSDEAAGSRNSGGSTSDQGNRKSIESTTRQPQSAGPRECEADLPDAASPT